MFWRCSQAISGLFPKFFEFLYVCQSVSWLTFLLNLWKCRDIICSGWDIFLKFFETSLWWLSTISELFGIFCMSVSLVSWPTLLLKLCSYRDISTSVWDTFLKFFGGFPWMFVYNVQIIWNFLHVCQSVSWLTPLLKLGQYRYLLYWIRFLFKIFWTLSCNKFTIESHNSEFFACLSVC